jgi:hypothetical protein
LTAGSTDRRNTFCELLSWGLIEQGLSRPGEQALIEARR